MSELALTTAPGISVSPTALTITNPNITFEEVQYALDHASMLGDTVRWWIGDLLLYAEGRFGEEYAQLLDGLRVSERQSTKYRWVAESVGHSLRRENLSFSHHELVAALPPPDQERLLALAEVGTLSVAALREAVHDHKAFEAHEPDPPRRQVVLPPSEVDAARGVREVRETLRQVAQRIESPELREATGIDHSMRALDHVGRTVRRAGALEPLALAVAAVIAAGVRQSGLPDPAVIVPAGPWDTLVAAYATATEGGK
jgi:hypothetical protein